MKWHRFTRYIAPDSNYRIFEAIISENNGYQITYNPLCFSEIFKALASGTYSIDYIPTAEYKKWHEFSSTKDIPYTKINFDSTNALENIKKFMDWEKSIGRSKSKIEEIELEKRFSLRFVSPLLVPDDGVQPQALAQTTQAASSFSEMLKNYRVGEHVEKFIAASAGYDIYTAKQDDRCMDVLNNFLSNIENNIFLPPCEENDKTSLNILINSLKKISSIPLIKIEFLIGDKKHVLLPEQIEHLNRYEKKKQITYDGKPHKVSLIKNTFKLITNSGEFACHTDSLTDVEFLMQRVNAIASDKKNIIVYGEIEEAEPATIKLSQIVF